MKKTYALLASVLLPLSVTACNGQSKASEPAKKTDVPPAEESAKPAAADKATEPKQNIVEVPKKDAPAKDAPAKDAPAKDAPAKDASAEDAPAEDAPATAKADPAEKKKADPTADTGEKTCDLAEDIAAIEASLDKLKKSAGQSSEQSTKLAAAEKNNQAMAAQMVILSQKLQAGQKSEAMVQQLTAKSKETNAELEALRKANAELKAECESAHASVHALRKKVESLVKSFEGAPVEAATE